MQARDNAHIAMLIPSLCGGGAERSVLRTARGLVERGHRVDVVLFRPLVDYHQDVSQHVRIIILCGRRAWRRRSRADMPKGTVWSSERADTLNLVGLASGLVRDFRSKAPELLKYTAFRRAARFSRYVERERPDIVFANLPSVETAAFLGSRLVPSAHRPPIVPVIRGAVDYGPKYRCRRQLLFPEASGIVAVSQGVADFISATLDLPKDMIDTIYNPACMPDIAEQARVMPDHPWFRDDGSPIVIGVGWLNSQKDFPTLIRAFRLVRAQRPCRLLILGEGPMRHELEDLVIALDLEGQVSLPGWMFNPFAFMARAALFVLSSRYEGFGNVLVEAMACGCPAVSTNCPAGPSEILEDPDLLAPVGDPDALADIMLRALARPVDRETLRAKAKRFSLDRAADGYERVVTKLTAAKV